MFILFCVNPLVKRLEWRDWTSVFELEATITTHARAGVLAIG